MRRRVIAIASFLVAVAACGGAGTSGHDGGSNGNGFAGTCCLDNVSYACPSQQAYTACVGFDAAMCHANCGADIACNMGCDTMAQNATHDPSQCTRNPSGDNMCNVTTASCQEVPSNPSCVSNSDCASGNCTKGHCYGNGQGNLCSANAQCDSGNCTGGCCQGNGVGSACSADIQCDSGNCTGGQCQGNGSGSPCNAGVQCASDQCSGGVCA